MTVTRPASVLNLPDPSLPLDELQSGVAILSLGSTGTWFPSAPRSRFIVREEIDRLNRGRTGMRRTHGGCCGQAAPCKVFDYRFVGLSHNTVRGAAGGAILMAELLKVEGIHRIRCRAQGARYTGRRLSRLLDRATIACCCGDLNSQSRESQAERRRSRMKSRRHQREQDTVSEHSLFAFCPMAVIQILTIHFSSMMR